MIPRSSPHSSTLRGWQFYLLLVAVGLVTRPVFAEQAPLHERIDQLVEADHVGTPAPLAGDSAFLRRIYLDLHGKTPPVEVTRQFLADESPNKRQQLIDRLLSSPDFARHMASTFDLMLMERRADKHVKAPEWKAYLTASVAANKPFNQLAREILGADGVDDKQRAAAKFYLDREGETNLLTRDVGRVFLGMDLQCAQCHDHPLIDDYYQSDYYGIFAFLNRSYLYADKKAKKTFFAEKAEGDVTFKSVFTDESGSTGPRLPGGEPVTEPKFAKGDEYSVKPAKDVRPIPKFSRRAQLAQLATDGTNQAFNRNVANRLWAHLMGRGLVHPVDLHHAANPPVHPELLQMLADELVGTKFDVKALLRQIALTRTYQRGFDMPANLAEQAKSAEQELASLESQVETLKADAKKLADIRSTMGVARSEAKKILEPLQGPYQKVADQVATARLASQAEQKKLAELKSRLSDVGVLATAFQTIADQTQMAAELTNDATLRKVVEQMRARAGKSAAEVKKITSEVATQQPKATKAGETLAAAEQELAKLQPAYAKARQAFDAQQDKYLAARKSCEAAEQAVRLAERRVSQARQLTAVRDQAAATGTVEAQLKATLASLARQEATTKSMETRLQEQSRQLTSTRQQRDASAKAMAEMMNAREEMRARFVSVQDLAEKAAAASQQFAEDRQLSGVQGQLVAYVGKLRDETSSLDRQVAARQTELNQRNEQLATLDKSVAELRQTFAGATETLQTLRKQLEGLEAERASIVGRRDELLTDLVEDWTQRFTVSSLKPLSPEQLAWSTMEVTGLLDRYRRSAKAELDKKKPLAKDATAEQQRQREVEIEAAAQAKLQGQVAAFVKLFGAGAGQPQGDFFSTVDQALFLANGSQIRGWLAPSGGNLSDRMNKLATPEEVAEELYLSVLCRKPTSVEIQDVARELESRPKEKTVVVQDLAWGLLTSAEFRFSH